MKYRRLLPSGEVESCDYAPGVLDLNARLIARTKFNNGTLLSTVFVPWEEPGVKEMFETDFICPMSPITVTYGPWRWNTIQEALRGHGAVELERLEDTPGLQVVDSWTLPVTSVWDRLDSLDLE